MFSKDTKQEYGWVSIFLHWLLAMLVLFQFFTALWTIYVLPKDSPAAAFYIGKLHIPLGITTAIVAVLAILWYISNTHPTLPLLMPTWEKITARLVHKLLYLCVIIMPLSGLLTTVAGGHPPNFFGFYQFPQFMAIDKDLSHFFFEIHETTGFILLGLIILHVLAALKHHFIDRDDVLKRML